LERREVEVEVEHQQRPVRRGDKQFRAADRLEVHDRVVGRVHREAQFPCARVPGPQDAVQAAGNECRAVAQPGERTDRRVVRFDSPQQRAGVGVVEADILIRTGGGEGRPVRRIGDRVDRIARLAQRTNQRSARRVPELHGVIA
jgi:hypothetical protein